MVREWGVKKRREDNRVHETREQKGDESKGPLESKWDLERGWIISTKTKSVCKAHNETHLFCILNWKPMKNEG